MLLNRSLCRIHFIHENSKCLFLLDIHIKKLLHKTLYHIIG